LAKYRRWGYRDWGFLPTVLEIKALNIRGRVDFLLDTGAGQTILSEKDARRLGVPCQNLPRGRPAVGVGGVSNTWKIDKKITLYVPTVGHRIYVAHRNGVEILEEPTDEKRLPSLLGLEFLEGLDFKLTFDMPTRSIFLER
jgi:predicted aspartyl protease